MENYKNHKIEIWYDEDARWDDYEHLGTFYTNIPREFNPDNHLVGELRNDEGLINGDKYVFVCVNAYIHGGIALSTSEGWPFNDRWDSCFAGCMACTMEKARNWFGKECTKKDVVECLESEVRELNAYASGEVYGFTIYKDGEWIEAVGSYTDYDNCINAAKGMVDAYEQGENEAAFKEQMETEFINE